MCVGSSPVANNNLLFIGVGILEEEYGYDGSHENVHGQHVDARRLRRSKTS